MSNPRSLTVVLPSGGEFTFHRLKSKQRASFKEVIRVDNLVIGVSKNRLFDLTRSGSASPNRVVIKHYNLAYMEALLILNWITKADYDHEIDLLNKQQAEEDMRDDIDTVDRIASKYSVDSGSFVRSILISSMKAQQ